MYGTLNLSELKDDKIWIQYEGTEEAIANELTEAGIPKTGIVLAYHFPVMRQYNGFAMG